MFRRWGFGLFHLFRVRKKRNWAELFNKPSCVQIGDGEGGGVSFWRNCHAASVGWVRWTFRALALHSGRMVAVKFGKFSSPTCVNISFHHISLYCKRRFRREPTFMPKFNSNLRRNNTYRFKERSRILMSEEGKWRNILIFRIYFLSLL